MCTIVCVRRALSEFVCGMVSDGADLRFPALLALTLVAAAPVVQAQREEPQVQRQVIGSSCSTRKVGWGRSHIERELPACWFFFDAPFNIDAGNSVIRWLSAAGFSPTAIGTRYATDVGEHFCWTGSSSVSPVQPLTLRANQDLRI